MAQVSRSTFGKYVLLRKLASGGMGEVFLAKQRGPSGFEKLLVIKRILSHHLDKRDYLDMFFSEAKLVARLNHNNIIQIQEMGEIDGDYYIAMEYVRGKSLRDVIDELRAEGRMLPLPHVIDLAIKLCEGLAYAHQARDIRGRPMNIVHRDINPHNVLVSYNGDLKLIDFGIAKSEMTSVHTATGTIKGKFVYMSPEQSAADPIDRRSDIFSLGIVLYEMTALENPFVRQNVVLSLEAIQRQATPPPSSKRPDAAPLDAILLRALEKRPEDRYQSAVEMRDDLRNLFRNAVVDPAEEDISIFLHDLFRADIEEEDRLLAEADRATAGLLAADGAATRPAFEIPVSPQVSLSELPGYEAHSSDEEAAEPARVSSFLDEEPTLSTFPEASSKRPSDGHGARAVSGRESARSPEVVPNGQVMTLIPPEEVIGNIGDLPPESPTRSDRVPLRRNSMPPAPPSSGSGPHAPMSAVSNGGLAALPAPSTSQPPMLPNARSTSTPPAAVDGVPSVRSSFGQAAFDEPLPDPIRRSSMPPYSSPGLSPETLVPPAPLDGASSAITDEDSGALTQPVPPWRRVGLWVGGLLMFAATAFAGFHVTRALTKPTKPISIASPTPVGEGREPPRAVDPEHPTNDVEVPAPAPDPKLLPVDAVKRDDPKLDPASDKAAAEKAAVEKSAAEKAAADKEAADKKRLEEKAAAEKAAADKAAAEKAAAEKKLADAKAAEERIAAERASRADADRRKAEEDRAKRAAAEEEKKKKAEEEKRLAEEAKQRKLDEEKAKRAAAEEEKKRKAEEEKAKRAAAEEEKKKKAEEEKRLAAERAAKAAAQKSTSATNDAKSASKATSEVKQPEEPKRRVVLPSEVAETTEKTAEKAVEKVAEKPVEKVPVTPPIEKPAEKEPPVAAKVQAEKPADGGGARVGTLTLSTSVEVSVELDGKTLGTSPAVISVKRPTGKIKLFGPNVEGTVTLSYKVEDGGISVTVDANPWSFLKHNGISLPKTPQTVAAESKHRIALFRPGQRAPLVVSLLWTAKN